MPTTYRWRPQDRETLQRLRTAWPELDIREGARMAHIRITSLKALARFLKFVAEDEDLASYMRPALPGVSPDRPHWWYTLVETAPLEFVAQINVPPGDLKGILSRTEAQ